MNVESLVHRLGICSIYRGYSFLIYAVELAVRNEEYLLYITKELYPDVAKHFHSTSTRIERSLRTVITTCWNERCWTALPDMNCSASLPPENLFPCSLIM